MPASLRTPWPRRRTPAPARRSAGSRGRGRRARRPACRGNRPASDRRRRQSFSVQARRRRRLPAERAERIERRPHARIGQRRLRDLPIRGIAQLLRRSARCGHRTARSCRSSREISRSSSSAFFASSFLPASHSSSTSRASGSTSFFRELTLPAGRFDGLVGFARFELHAGQIVLLDAAGFLAAAPARP